VTVTIILAKYKAELFCHFTLCL